MTNMFDIFDFNFNLLWLCISRDDKEYIWNWVLHMETCHEKWPYTLGSFIKILGESWTSWGIYFAGFAQKSRLRLVRYEKYSVSPQF